MAEEYFELIPKEKITKKELKHQKNIIIPQSRTYKLVNIFKNDDKKN